MRDIAFGCDCFVAALSGSFLREKKEILPVTGIPSVYQEEKKKKKERKKRREKQKQNKKTKTKKQKRRRRR